jgi:hypothetical protein
VDVAAAALSSHPANTTAAHASAALLRTALDQQIASSAQLLEVLPQPQAARPGPSLEAHLGGRLDVYG